MAHLHVSVRYQGMVVEDRVVPVYDGMRLGEHLRAEVSFPGADVAVRKAGERLMIRGLWVAEGEQVELYLGQVQVSMEHVHATRLRRPGGLRGDMRILVATAAVALFGAWWEAATDFVLHDPAAYQVVASLRSDSTSPDALQSESLPRAARINPDRRADEHEDTGSLPETPGYDLLVTCAPDGPVDPERYDDPGLDRVCRTP